MEFINHDLVPDYEFAEILYEERPVFDSSGDAVDGLHAVPKLVEPGRCDRDQQLGLVREVAIGCSPGHAEAPTERPHRYARGPSLCNHCGGFVQQCRPEVPVMIRAVRVSHHQS